MPRNLILTSGPQTVTPPSDRVAGGSRPVLAAVVKIISLGTVTGLVVALTFPLLASRRWAFLAALWAIVAVLVWVYATGRRIPAKYLAPGTLFLVVLVVYPILMTFQLSGTNYGDGTRTSKEVSVAQILGNSARQVENSRSFNLSVGSQGTATSGPFAFLLVEPQSGDAYLGTPEGLEPLAEGRVTVEDDEITAAEGYTLLTPSQINELSRRGGPLEGFTVPVDEGVIQAQGFDAVELYTPLEYDPATDTITNVETGVSYRPEQIGDRKYFTSDDGERLSTISWGESIGLQNYVRIFTDPRISKDFFGIFAWTLTFAVVSVAGTFGLGLLLATALNKPGMRGQRIYRSLLILPYAIPGFISLLVWSGFYNSEFGLVNTMLGLNINWFGDPFWAKVAVIITNLWMGFPYMFLVSTGALQAIPGDLKDAASLDGATGFTSFRNITFPLLLVSVGPLLVATFAFNFNNFGAIFLLTEGGPFSPANPTAGATDILISYTYRLAFGVSAQQIGFAAAISVILFILTGVLAAIQFRATRALEDVG